MVFYSMDPPATAGPENIPRKRLARNVPLAGELYHGHLVTALACRSLDRSGPEVPHGRPGVKGAGHVAYHENDWEW